MCDTDDTSLLIEFSGVKPEGISRAELRLMSERLQLSEVQVIHLALARLARDLLGSPAYELDDGPLTDHQFEIIQKLAQSQCRAAVVVRNSII